jgi:acetolactate synthase-1/2/3 large subunit
MDTNDDVDGPTGGDLVCAALADAGIGLVVGLPGTQTLPIDRAVARHDDVEYLMVRHETAAPHVAWGHYEAGGGPAATLTVPGPGETNAMHGLKNALEDGVPLVHLAADADPGDRGKGPIHEIEPDTYDNVVKENVVVDRAVDLPGGLARAVATAEAPPYGPVRVGVAKSVLSGAVRGDVREADVTVPTVDHDTAPAVEEALSVLRETDRRVVVAGGGVRRTDGGPAVVDALSRALDAPVCVTLKGKGTFPEADPRFLGATGTHCPAGTRRVLREAGAVVALGTDLDGVSTDNWAVPMGERLIHVTLDPDDVDRGYEADVVVPGDGRAVGEALLDGLGYDGPREQDPFDEPGYEGAAGRVARAVREEYDEQLRAAGALAEGPPPGTVALVRAVRAGTPEGVPVVTDIGGARLWSVQTFESSGPERFVNAGSWAGMGTGFPGAVGAALADGSAVTITGDGGLMMCIHELHTAASAGLNVVCVVANNADYGVISGQPGAPDFSWESPSFVDVAAGFGCRATEAESASDVREAVADAIERPGPDLIDVRVDDDVAPASVVGDYEPSAGWESA